MSSEAEHLPEQAGPLAGFAPGTQIRCANSVRRVEAIRPGDLVSTASNGARPVRTAAARILTGGQLTPALQPIRIERDAFGGGFPRRDLTLSPQHRLLVRGARLAQISGQREGLVTAASLLGAEGVRQLDRSEVTYIHLLFDAPEIIFANGWGTESLSSEVVAL